jgi:hypothetical protein
MKPSERLKRDLEALHKFRDFYIGLLNASEFGGDWMDRPTVPSVSQSVGHGFKSRPPYSESARAA